MVKRTKIISEDLFVKTVVELAEIRERLKNSKRVKKTIRMRLFSKPQYLYRGLPLYKVLKRIHGGKTFSKDIEEKLASGKKLLDDDCDSVIKYLVGKVVLDPAPSSTSLDMSVAENFSIDALYDTGAILVIDVSKYNKGQNLESISKLPHEKEVLLPMGIKLKIKSVSLEKGHPEKGTEHYFKINCVPV